MAAWYPLLDDAALVETLSRALFVADCWGRLSAQIGHGGADLQIAATALHHDAVVVTRNVSDFEPTGCRIENPFA